MDVAPLKGKLEPFSTLDGEEEENILAAMDSRCLSGYLGGIHRGGYWIERLKAEWSEAFDVPFVTPCNSATSGLLVACMAAGVGPGDLVYASNYTMSATAACAKVLGARVRLIDIEPLYLQLNPLELVGWGEKPKAVVVANLHGHPAELAQIRGWADKNAIVMIEDNAQSPFAMEGNRYAGTIGHIGVFSLNVHKHIQCGEGGIVVTSDPGLRDAIDAGVNHGELGPSGQIGLNLRMVETTAAVACAQLAKGPKIIGERIAIAERLNQAIRDIPLLDKPKTRVGCKHVYYIWAAQMALPQASLRDAFVSHLNYKGVPMRAGYSKPLKHIFRTQDVCPISDVVDDRLVCFEICGYDPTDSQLKQIDDILHWAAEECHGNSQLQKGRGRHAERRAADQNAQPQ